MSHFRSLKSALIIFSLLVAAGAAPALAGASLDIRPSVCPNLISRNARTVLPVALVSDVDFVVSRLDIDTATLELSRADGVGGIAKPIVRRTFRPATRLVDVAAPAVSGMCSTFGADGIRDLSIVFGQANVVSELELRNLPLNSFVELCLSGQTGDGTPFSACDHVIVSEFRLFATPPPDDDDLGTLPRLR